MPWTNCLDPDVLLGLTDVAVSLPCADSFTISNYEVVSRGLHLGRLRVTCELTSDQMMEVNDV